MTAARRKKIRASLPTAVLAPAEERARGLGGDHRERMSLYIEALMRIDQERPIPGLETMFASLLTKAAVKRAARGRATIARAREKRTRPRET